MVSLHTDSLFANIPLSRPFIFLHFTCWIWHWSGFNGNKHHELWQLAANEDIPVNGSYYDQIDGIALGSSLEPTWRTLAITRSLRFMNVLISTGLSGIAGTLLTDRQMHFAFLESGNIPPCLHEYFNKRHSSVQFAVEKKAWIPFHYCLLALFPRPNSFALKVFENLCLVVTVPAKFITWGMQA